MLPKPGDNNQEAGAPAGQDLKRPHLAFAHCVAANYLPQVSAFFRGQRFQPNDTEQLEEWLLRIVQPLETTDGSSEQHNLGFRLQDPTKLPAKVVVHVLAE